jgi:NADH dehydrogenase (ubiquinone) 1 alpha subcomplex subunit 2
VENAVRIEGLGKADISKQLEELVKKGESMPRSTESEGALA